MLRVRVHVIVNIIHTLSQSLLIIHVAREGSGAVRAHGSITYSLSDVIDVTGENSATDLKMASSRRDVY